MAKYETPEDAVNPQHYQRFPVQVIEITENLSYNLGNAVKYCARAGYKDDAILDLQKAAWYIQREIERLQRDS